jgi:hypothetical protein
VGILSSDPRTLAREAYTYLYPLVIMHVTRQQAINMPPGSGSGIGGVNAFGHIRAFPTADFRAVVRPNFDTLYSPAWVDLNHGPVVLRVADTGGRYFMLPMLDMWTEVFANPGSRTTGTGPQAYAILPPGHSGPAPDDLPAVEAPTPYVWIIGRTQTNGPDDYKAVHAIQDGFVLELPAQAPPHRIDPQVDTTTEPVRVVDAMGALDFLALAADLLREIPPHPTDFDVLARVAGLGIAPGLPFDVSRFDLDDLTEIEAGVGDARSDLVTFLGEAGTKVNGWAMLLTDIGVYGNAYLQRAAIAMAGLGANPPQDAVYPLLTVDADGRPLDGAHDYVLHFDAGGLPPVAAFWSVTVYDREGFQVANELDRFALGDRDPLVFNADGSLDLYLRRTSPGPDREANWLPTAAGPLGVTMRLYAPSEDVVRGRWGPPPARRT